MKPRRRCRPEVRKRLHPDPVNDGVLVGPQFDLDRSLRWYYGPRCRIGGRWVVALRASHLLYGDNCMKGRSLAQRRAVRLDNLRERFAQRAGLHRYMDFPF